MEMERLGQEKEEFLKHCKVDWTKLVLHVTSLIEKRNQEKEGTQNENRRMRNLSEKYPWLLLGSSFKSNSLEEMLTKLLDYISENGKKIESLAKEVRNWDDYVKGPTKQYASWKVVAFNILNHPTNINFNIDDCPNCGEKRIGVFYYPVHENSSGPLVFCPNCKRQDYRPHSFYCEKLG